jgi:hypothetical protein
MNAALERVFSIQSKNVLVLMQNDLSTVNRDGGSNINTFFILITLAWVWEFSSPFVLYDLDKEGTRELFSTYHGERKSREINQRYRKHPYSFLTSNLGFAFWWAGGTTILLRASPTGALYRPRCIKTAGMQRAGGKSALQQALKMSAR